MKKRFTKNQEVFKVSPYFCENREKNVQFIQIVKRIVDACGAKQMTFFDRGNDSCYGKRTSADTKFVHATLEEAIAFANEQCEAMNAAEQNRDSKQDKSTYIVSDIVISDADDICKHADILKASV